MQHIVEINLIRHCQSKFRLGFLCVLCVLCGGSSVLFAPFAVDSGGLPYSFQSVKVSELAGVAALFRKSCLAVNLANLPASWQGTKTMNFGETRPLAGHQSLFLGPELVRQLLE